MAERPNRLWRWLGALPAALALGAQLAFASWGLVLLGAASDPLNAFDPHALCRAADEGSSDAPDHQTPAGSTHKHLGFCCLAHQLAGVQPVLAHVSEPVGYVLIACEEPEPDLFTTAPLYDPGKARAPPPVV